MPTTPTSPARRGRAKQTPPTLVLFVRHGTTPTTGQVLPGRAPGLHLSDTGRTQAKRVAERLAAWAEQGPAPPAARGRNQANAGQADAGQANAGQADAGQAKTGQANAGQAKTGRPARPDGVRPSAVYASPLERTRETASPIAAALGVKLTVRRGLLECDFGEWTGAELKTLAKKPEWTTVQRYPSGFQFPGGESFSGMQARMVDTTTALVAEHPGEAVVAVSHADPIKAVVAAALGTHLDLFQRIVISPCSVTAISYGPGGPTVLAVNSTGTLKELRPS